MVLIIFHPRQVKAKKLQLKRKTNKSRSSYVRGQKIKLSCRVKRGNALETKQKPRMLKPEKQRSSSEG